MNHGYHDEQLRFDGFRRARRSRRPDLSGRSGNAAEAQTVLGGKLVVCGVCHGVNERAETGGCSIIWGLQENYVLKQLREFRHGDRASDTIRQEDRDNPSPRKRWGPQRLTSRQSSGRDPQTPRPPRSPPQWRYARLVISKKLVQWRSGTAARRSKVRLPGRGRCAALRKVSEKNSPGNEQHQCRRFRRPTVRRWRVTSQASDSGAA